MTAILRRILAPLLVLVVVSTPAAAQTTTALLDALQHTAFNFFWTEVNPANGLIRDRNAPGSTFCSIASVGFGLSAIPIGVDHAWVTRAQARTRVRTTLNTFYTGPQGTASVGTIGYKGFFYHFLNMNTATRWDNSVELSSIDSALLFAGMMDARQYFDDPADPDEIQIRLMADSLVQRADWNFFRNFNPGVMMGWKPAFGFVGFGQWIGYNEAMILYIEALGSTSYQVPASTWSTWTSG